MNCRSIPTVSWNIEHPLYKCNLLEWCDLRPTLFIMVHVPAGYKRRSIVVASHSSFFQLGLLVFFFTAGSFKDGSQIMFTPYEFLANAWCGHWQTGLNTTKNRENWYNADLQAMYMLQVFLPVTTRRSLSRFVDFLSTMVNPTKSGGVWAQWALAWVEYRLRHV